MLITLFAGDVVEHKKLFFSDGRFLHLIPSPTEPGGLLFGVALLRNKILYIIMD